VMTIERAECNASMAFSHNDYKLSNGLCYTKGLLSGLCRLCSRPSESRDYYHDIGICTMAHLP
jgi:hypothetical protein